MNLETNICSHQAMNILHRHFLLETKINLSDWSSSINWRVFHHQADTGQHWVVQNALPIITQYINVGGKSVVATMTHSFILTILFSISSALFAMVGSADTGPHMQTKFFCPGEREQETISYSSARKCYVLTILPQFMVVKPCGAYVPSESWQWSFTLAKISHLGTGLF